MFLLNRLEAKVNIFRFQKTRYPRAQLTEIYQHRVEPQNFAKRAHPNERINNTLSNLTRGTYNSVLLCELLRIKYVFIIAYRH